MDYKLFVREIKYVHALDIHLFFHLTKSPTFITVLPAQENLYAKRQDFRSLKHKPKSRLYTAQSIQQYYDHDR